MAAKQQNLHSTIKEEEKSDCSHVQSPCPTLDQPLVIVLDDENDDDDDDNDDDLIASSIDQNKTTKVKRKANRSKRKKTYRAAVIVERNYMRQSPHRTKLVARRKHQSSSSTVTMSTKNLNMDSNSDSILSRISFDTNTDILTVSRMGSIFYCLEDLYHKVFLSLCSFEEFHDFILKPSIISIKQVTLSEKMAIQQQNPLLKKLSDVPYRLISINSSDYFLKLKQLLINQNHSDDNRQQQQRDKMIDQIIDEMRSYKRTPTPILGKDKVSHSPMTTKRHSSDDEDDDDDDDDDERDHEPCKRLKIVTKKAKTNENPSLAAAQFGIFIQCNGPVSCNIFSTNETVSSSTTTTTTTNNTTSTNDPVKVETDPIGKTSPMKKSSSETENHSRMFIEKFSVSQCNYSSKTNSTNNRIDPTSARDLSQTIKPSPCPTSSPTMTNMPIKRRILNLYNNDGNESSVTAPATHIDSTPRRRTSSHRLFFRSKSFDVTRTSSLTEKVRRRSTTLPSRSTKMIVANRSPVHSKINAMEQCLSKSHPKSSKGESIDLTDENFPMPMIVNVEENVELAHQRQQRKNLESRPPVATPTPSIPKQFHRPTSHENLPNHNNNNNNNNNHHHHHNNSTNNNNTKSSVVPSHPLPASFYRRSPYQAYHHQESYHYRDPTHPSPPVTSSSASGATSMSQSAYSSLHSTNNLSMTTNFYPYPTHPTSAYHSAMKNSKDSPHPNNNHDPRLTSATPNPSQTGLMTQHHQMPPSSVVMPIVRKPNYYHNLTPEQQASIKMQLSPPTSAANPCRLACCYPSSMNPQQQTGHPPSIDKNYHHERMIYREYSAPPTAIKREISQTPDPLSASAAANRKQRRLDSLPPSSSPYPTYPPSKSCFIPPHPPSAATSSIGNGSWPSTSPSVATGAYPPMKPAVRYPYPAPSAPPPMMSSFMQKRIESCFAQNQAVAPVPAAPQRPTPVPARAPSAAPAFVPPTSSTMISPPNTPHDITLPNARLRTIDLQRAMIERGFCDVDKIPKLVIRHLKTYTTRTVETMGQLFPTWFNEPDYRCIHCFRCDQVFTPQQFMTHVDDEQMQNEQPINMTSIQLLTSEKMSEYKVQLWNQFCTNLTVYAREGRIGGFSTNRAV